jgi:host factor-I protein
MAPFSESELDTSTPGVRLLQQWIRQRRQLCLQLAGGAVVQGRMLWQDGEFLAVVPAGQERPDLLNRRLVERISPLEQEGVDAPTATIPSPRLPMPPT